MLNKRLITLVAVFVLALGAFSTVSAQDGTIVDVAAGDENFSTLVELVTAAELVDTLSGEGPFTVFAPTNDAFAALPDFVIEYLGSNPEALTQVLTYHVVAGAAVMSGDLEPEQMVATVEGSELTVVANDMGVMVDQASVVAADVEASNGVIHAIDSVVLPPISLDVIPADVTGDIVMAGSSTVGPLTIAVADEFTAEGYTGEISVAITGSGAGFERFCEAGETDLSNASRAIRQEEVDNCLAIDRNPIEFRVGTDAIAVVVGAGAAEFASDLTLEELAQAFSTATTWADINPDWPEEDILRFAPGTDSGTYDFFVEEIFEEDEGPIQAASNIQFSEDDNVLVEGVANNDFAIGFFGFAFYAENQDILSILSLDGVEANAANVDSGEYALARPLFVYGDYDIIQEKPQTGQFMAYYLENVNRLLISDVTGESATVLDSEGNVIEYNVSVAYFEANPFALNASKWVVAAANAMAAGM